MVEHLSDSMVKFERFEEYWEGAQKAKTMTFRVIPDASARVMALEAGDIDICFNPTVNDIATITANDNLVMTMAPSLNVEYFGFNCSNEPFSDEHARYAVSYAINKQELIDGAQNGVPTAITSVLVPGAFGYNDHLTSKEYDLAKAKEELSKSKYPNGFEFTVYTTKSRNTTAQLMQYQLSQIGVTMNVEFGTAVPDHALGGYSGALWSAYQNPTMDGSILNNYFIKDGSNARFFYDNAEVADLLEKAKVEMDAAKRKSLYEQAQQLIADDVPMVPLYNNKSLAAANKHVKGFNGAPSTSHYFYTAYYEE
jgi:peptide/nickel transport system substrate-binding protein